MLDGDISGLQVCSPQVEFVNLDEYSPEKVLMNMRKWKYPSSLGGFHDVEVEDYTIYSMAYLLSSTKPSKKSTEQLMALFKKHPMSKIFSFVPFFNQEMCAKLLAVTLDPRWYVDLSNPDKLYKYYNPKQISFEIIDPRTKPVEVDRLGMKQGNLLFMEYGEGVQSAISRLNQY